MIESFYKLLSESDDTLLNKMKVIHQFSINEEIKETKKMCM